PDLGLEAETAARAPAQAEAFDAGARAEAQLLVGPEAAEVEVRGGAARAVAGHCGLAAVGVEDAQDEVGVAAPGEPLDDGHAVRARAEVAVADAADEVAQRVGLAEGFEACAPADGRELFGLEDEVVVTVAVEFDESQAVQGLKS